VVEVFAYVPFNIANALTVSTVDAKGDLLVGTGADAVGRLAVGTANQLLAVDSSTATGLKWANPGMTLISTTSFSAVGTASLPTSTFTSTYDNYRLIVKISATTSDAVLYMKMRASGTDSSASYYYALLGYSSNPSTENKSGGNVTTGIFLQDLDTGSSAKPTWSIIDLFVPQQALATLMNIQSVANTQTGTPAASVGMGYHALSTAYDSITLVPSAGNISGSIVVYGYNK
jgi:hypothetical protein